MTWKGLSTVIVLLGLWLGGASPQQEDERYVPETDPLVLKNLEHWQDIKFGLLMHWGPYTSWSTLSRREATCC